MSLRRYQITEIQQTFYDMVNDFCGREVVPQAIDIDRNAAIPASLWTTLSDLGLTGASFPETDGGSEFDSVSMALGLEVMARTSAPLAFALTCQLHAARLAAALCPSEQRADLVTPLVTGARAGAVAGFGLIPPVRESGVAQIVRAGADLLLTGSCQVVGGTPPELLLVIAADAGQDSYVAVPAGSPGVTLSPAEPRVGLRGVRRYSVELEGVRVPASALLGRVADVPRSVLDAWRLDVAAIAVGLAAEAAAHCREHVLLREQFGRPVGKFTAVQEELVESTTAIETARLWMLNTARTADAGLAEPADAAIAQRVATRAGVEVTYAAIRVFGAYGYSREYPLERFHRDALVLQALDPTEDETLLAIIGHVIPEVLT